ncbi:hypothetical protein KY347_06375 [Candidatus Woesearchaeota archaeon]|nr:hypothetical protein [Candidatus Woesearchaeota archaeon]
MWNKFKQMSKFKQILFALLIGFAVVSFWRGVWGLLDIYLLPDNFELSLWISLVMGVVVLIGTHYTVKELT